MTDPAKVCPKCGGRMTITHSGTKGTLLDKRRQCKACHHVDRVLIRQEIVAIEKVCSRVCIHTLDPEPSPPPRQ